MKIIFFVIFIFILVFGALIVDAPTMLILIIAYSIGLTFTRLLNKSQKKTVSIYSILFLVASIYMIVCYYFMTEKGFKYLFAIDILDYFYPMSVTYLEKDNYWEILSHIWESYQFFDRRFVGYFTYSTLWGMIAKILNANLFVTLQISVLFLYSFIGVILYRIFLKCNFSISQAYKFTLVISLCTILFFWSSVFLRDIHIALLYLLAIYQTFNSEFSRITLIKLIIIILITCTFRIESGLFLFILIPTYLLLSLYNSKQKIYVISISLSVLIITGIYILNNINAIELIISNNKENYALKDTTGMISTFQSIPILGDFLSIIYTALQPIPFWGVLNPIGKPQSLGEETYNIMGFPQSINGFFNWSVIFYIMIWILSPVIRKRTKGNISKPLVYNLWIGLFFLLMQSSVVEQRRIIAYYCMFYILFFIIYSHLKSSEKRQFNIISIFGFIILQLVGVLYLSY